MPIHGLALDGVCVCVCECVLFFFVVTLGILHSLELVTITCRDT